MNQRTLMLIAAGLTAFVLVLTGGLLSRMNTATAGTAATAAPAESAPTTAAAPALDPAVEALIREREAAYQAALADANARLAQANAQITRNNQPFAAAPAAPLFDGSAEAAAAVAVQYRGGGEVRAVEQETEHGMVAYEVKFHDGAEIYVDAQTGQVVYADLGEAEYEQNED